MSEHIYKHAIQLLRVLSDGKIHTFKTLFSSLQRTTPLALLHSKKLLSDSGMQVETIKGLGLCWINRFSLIDPKILELYLQHQNQYFDVLVFDLLESTNTYLINSRTILQNQSRIPVIASEIQTKGRGTRNRIWFSNLGGSLTFSFLWQFDRSMHFLSSLSLVLAVSLVRVFRNLTFANIQIKWPNDILHNNQKFAGILVECKSNYVGSVDAIIGIGINFSLTSEQLVAINQEVTDLNAITGKSFDRNYVFALLLMELRCVLKTFEISGFNTFREEWLEYHAFQGKKIIFQLPKQRCIEGVVKGVHEDGSLLISTDAGEKLYNIGEISLRSNL